MRIYKISSLFHVPESVLAPLKSYIVEVKRDVVQNNRKRVTKKSYPTRTFVLNFGGTKLDFLNQLSDKNREIDVDIAITKTGTSFARLSSQTIVINLSDEAEPIARTLIDTLEHEVSHITQKLIGVYVNEKEHKTKGYRDFIGGLISPKMRDDNYDIHGRKKDTQNSWSQRSKRVEHSKREIEKQPDLLSTIRNLQYAYSFFNTVEENTNLSKKEFLEYFLSYPSELESMLPEKSKRAYSLSKFLWKQLLSHADKKEYQKWLYKTLYDEFVNKGTNFNFEQVNKDVDEINSIKEKRQQIGKGGQDSEGSKINPQEVVFNGVRSFGNEEKEIGITHDMLNKLGTSSIPSYDFGWDLFPDVTLAEEYLSHSEMGDYYEQNLPYIYSGWNEKHDSHVKVPTSPKKIKSIIKKVENLNDEPYGTPEIKQSFINGLLDNMIDEMNDKYWVKMNREDLRKYIESV